MTDPSGSPEVATALPCPLWVVDGSVPGDIGGGWRAGAGAVAGGGSALVSMAHQVGAYRWIEHRLFEVLGSWSAVELQPGAATLFAVLATQHAAHAERFAERLPVLATIDPEALGAPPPGWLDLLAELAAMVDPSACTPGGPQSTPFDQPGGPSPGLDIAAREPELWPTVARLVGLGRVVLPRLATAYARRLWWCTPSEAPLVPVLRGVLEDTRQAWLTVEAMVQDHLASDRGPAPGTSGSSGQALAPGGDRLLAAHQHRLEELVARSGGSVPPARPDRGPGER